MSDIKTISRQLYTDSIKHVYSFQVLPNSSLSNVNKIWNILLTLDFYVKEAEEKYSPTISLARNLKLILNNYRTSLYTYVLSINNTLTLAEAIENINFTDDSRNQYLFDSFFNSLLNTLFSYLDSDQEFFLQTNKQSLEALFALLVTTLNPYRRYFNIDIPTSFSNYSLVNDILEENSTNKSSFFNSPGTLDKSIAISSVNINNPVPYSSSENWISLFNNLKSSTRLCINNIINVFYAKNSLINSLESVIAEETLNYNSKLASSPPSFEGKEITDGNIKKIKITSFLNSQINIEVFLNHSIIYSNSLNASTKSKIIAVDKDSKTLTLEPYSGVSSDRAKFSLLTIKEGININKNFQSFTIDKNNSSLFSLLITSGTTTIKNVEFKIEDSAFRTNYIKFPVATSNPLTNGWNLNNQIDLRNIQPNNSFNAEQNIDNGITKLKIISDIPTTINISNWLNYTVFYFNSNNIQTKSKIISINKDDKTLTLYPYTGISSKNKTLRFSTTPEGVINEKNFQPFTINKTNSSLFSVDVIKDSRTINSINFKIKDSSFNTNCIKFPIATSNPLVNGWILNIKNPSSSNNLSVSFYREIENNNFILNKNNINSSGTMLYYDFKINDSELSENFNVNFNYNILSSNFSSSNLSLEISYFENNSEYILKTLSNLNSNNSNFNDSFLSHSSIIGYRFKIKFNNFNDSLKISFNNFYIGKNDISGNIITYNKPKKLISDLFLNTLIKNNVDAIISYSEIIENKIVTGYRLKLSSEPTHKGSNISFRITSVNTNFTWFISDSTLIGLNPLDIIYSRLSSQGNINSNFYRNTVNNNFILNKERIISNNLKLYYNFTIDLNDINQTLNINFDYNILNSNFSIDHLTLEITYSNNKGVETTLKTLSKLEKSHNTLKNYSDSFSVNSNLNYKFKISFASFEDTLKISFNNFYIGKNNINSNSITYNNPKQLISDLFLNSNFRNNKDFFLSHSQTSSTSNTGVTTISYKMKLSSEPIHVGSKISFKFYNVNTNFTWFISDSTLTGLDPITLSETGFEKKYYDSFISLNKRLFNIINAYALSRLLVPQAFDEENDQFNIGVNVNKSIKSYLSELLDEFKDSLTFKDDLLKDPRSNFLDSGQPIDTIYRTVEWKSGGVKDALGLKKFSEFKSQLEKIKKALKKVLSVLQAIEAFISILEQLIELGEDILGALLDQVIKQVQKVVDNIASTGVYFLPIFEYYAIKNSKSWWSSTVSNDLLGRQIIPNPYGGDPNIIVNSTFLKELRELEAANNALFQDDRERDVSRVGLNNKDKKIIPWLPFRSTTYEEFINVIIEGLLDEGDLPELGLILQKGETRIDDFVAQKEKGVDKKGVYNKISPDIIRPGAPKWTVGSNSMSVIVAICLPAPEDLIAGFEGLLRILLVTLKPIVTLFNLTYTGITDAPPIDNANERRKIKLDNLKKEQEEKRNKIKKIDKEIPSLNEQINNSNDKEEQEKLTDTWNDKVSEIRKLEDEIRELQGDIFQLVSLESFSDTPFPFNLNNLVKWIEDYLNLENTPPPSSRSEQGSRAKAYVSQYDQDTEISDIGQDIADWWNSSTLVDEALEERGGKFSGSRGTYPDFYGLSIGSIIPGTFSIIKGFLRKIKKLNEKESTFKLTEKFEAMIQPIYDFIIDIEDIIKSIENIINAIDALLNINISYLVIKSKNGVNDIVSQIEDATGFPNEDKRQIILGGFLGAGFIDPTGGEFDFGEYFKQASEEFDEEAKDLFNDLKSNNEEKGIGFLNKFFSA
jgi:hypothetical protein